MNALALAAVAPAPAAAPTAAPPPAADEAAAPGAFQRELQRATPRSSAERRERGERPERAEREATAAAGSAPASPADGSPATDGAAAADAATASAAGEPADTPPALDLSALLAGWVAPNAVTPPATPRAAAVDAANPGAADGNDGVDAAATARGPRGALPAGADATERAAGALATGDAQAAPRTLVSDSGSGFALPTALPAGAAGVQGGAANTVPAFADAARGAAVAERQLDTPVSHPGFAPALGAEVSLLVKDGVQQARLHLNPAEMGPITVQIQIDGDRAQVTLAAQQADTRQVLEQALPSLAGALRDSGLTLTGGGVFEQPRQAPRDGEPAPGGARAGGAAGDDEAADPGLRPGAGAPRGVVDLYA